MIQKYKTYFVSAFIIIICFLYGSIIHSSYNLSIANLLKESRTIFYNTVSIDRDLRLKRSNMPYSFGFTGSNIENQIKIERDGHSTVYLENSDSIRQLSHSMKHNHVIQSILQHKTPINVTNLDSLFQKSLYDENIKARTAIQYTDNTTGKTYYSNPDTASYRNYFAFEKIHAGLSNEITLQAFVKISPFTIIRRSIFPMGGITLIWIILMSVSTYFAVRKEKVREVEVEIFVTEPPKRNRIQLTDSILLDVDQNCLRYNGKEMQLTDLYIKFFVILLNKPDYFAGYDELISGLYSNIETGGRDRLDQLIKRLRTDVFPSIPEIELKNIPKKGYRLNFNV